MSGDRKLRLVPPVVGQDESGARQDEPPPSAREVAEAAESRALLERGEHSLALALRAAYEPWEIGPIDNDALVERALGDWGEGRRGRSEAPSAKMDAADAPAARAEQEAADRLREAMTHPRGEDQDEPVVEVFDALVSAYRPRGIDPLRNELLITRALRRSSQRTAPRRVLPFVAAAVLGVTAMAAGVALYLRSDLDKPVATTPSLQRSRSTADLFDVTTPFPRAGGESARVDRIATARAADLRDNRFALWGVR